MSLGFEGNYAKLQKCVTRTDFAGQWRKLKNGHKQFRTEGGAILNWWKSTGTIQFQGQDPGMKFEGAFISAASAKKRLESTHAEKPDDIQKENATLRKLIEGFIVKNAKLKRRVSKLKKRLLEAQ